MTLDITRDQDDWTPQQRAALADCIIGDPRQATPAMLAQFLHVCQRTGLDPWARQIYLRVQAGRASMQTSIDGLRLVAQRAAQTDGHRLSYGPTEWCGPDGAWRDVWLADEPPAAARLTVAIGDARYPAVARWAEYGSDRGMWRRMPALMIGKVCEALALRRAVPADLSGLYTADEMAQADSLTPPARPAASAASPSRPHLDWQPITDALAAGATREQVLASAGILLGLDGPADSLAALTEQGQVQAIADSLTPPARPAADDDDRVSA